jgi:ssDNA-binding Zn-finger/Zn-ribbon topoisomerase 1
MNCPNCGWVTNRQEPCPACHQDLGYSLKVKTEEYLSYLKVYYPEEYEEVVSKFKEVH